MAFPLTHLLVANELIKTAPWLVGDEPELFLLGSIAPDAVHYREGLVGASQLGIGEAKKITHLCPISDEKWGQTTDNIGWEKRAKDFFLSNTGGDVGASSLSAGYAAHVLTDIFTNMGIYHNFRTNYPGEAAKGYQSDYYRDLKNIDIRLYHEIYKSSGIANALANAVAQDMPGLVSADEIHAIRDNLLYEYYNSEVARTDTDYMHAEYIYVTYGEVLEFISDAAAYCAKVLSTSVAKGA